MKRNIVFLFLFAIVLFMSACDGTTPSTTEPGETPETTSAPEPTDAPETTEAPATTEAPESTDAPTTTATEGSDESETPWWILIMLGLGLLILIVVFTTRGSKKAPVASSSPNWKANARTGYAEARWLYDAMDEDTAVWRGNAQFDGATAVDASAGTNRAETWNAIQTRMGMASDALYALEAAAPDGRTADVARATIASMRSTRDALDARAEARFSYRTVAASAEDQGGLTEARDREVRASRNLAEARSVYATALTNLSGLV